MIFVLLGALLNGVLFLGGSASFQRVEAVRSRVRENVTDSARKQSADDALDLAEKVVLDVRAEQEAFTAELERLLARPDVSPEEFNAALDRMDQTEAEGFRRLTTVRRRLRTALTPTEWRLVFPPTSGR